MKSSWWQGKRLKWLLFEAIREEIPEDHRLESNHLIRLVQRG